MSQSAPLAFASPAPALSLLTDMLVDAPLPGQTDQRTACIPLRGCALVGLLIVWG